MSDERPDWVSQRAVAWVIDDAPVPANLFPVLMVIARRCDERGRGSRQSTQTIASKTGKSVDQVKRDIRDLKKAGLLLSGDESLVAHFPVWQRPSVYDVPLHVSGAKPSKEAKNKAGSNGRGGGMDTPPCTDTPGGMDGRGRGGMDTPGGGCTDTPLTKPLNNPMNNPSLSSREDVQPAAATVLPAEPERENEEASQQPKNDKPTGTLGILTGAGLSHDEARHFTDWADRLPGGPKRGGWYVTLHRNGTLQERIDEWRQSDTVVASCSECDDTGEVGDYLNRRACGCLWWKDPAAARKAFMAQLENFPPCPDGIPGGDLKAPNGWQACGTCRGPGWVDPPAPATVANVQLRSSERDGFRPSTGASRARQALEVADRLDRRFAHGKYANGVVQSPADQRVADAIPLYHYYKQLEEDSA